MKIWTLTSLLFAVLALSCGSSPTLNSFPGLEERVRQYYEFEKKRDWAAAFEFRTSEFRRSVPKSRYIASMQRDSTGWQFIDYRIKSVSKAADKVKLEMVFIEVPPTGFLSGPQFKGREFGPMEFEDASVWVQEDGDWYSYSPGARNHLTLNSALVVR